MDASAWRRKRLIEFKAPSGSVYKIKLPDPVTLISDWIAAGVEKPLDQKDLGEKVTRPDVIAKILMKYIVAPKITLHSTETTLGINELMEDQTDTLALYRKIISLFVEHAEETAEFFRSIGLGVESRPSRPSCPQASDGDFAVTVQRSRERTDVERGGDTEGYPVSRNTERRDAGG